MTRDVPAQEELLSIGDLAEATGIAPDTIRVWERRYGRPEAVRLPSGHRRYTAAHVRWLRRIAEALAHGHRPSKVVHLSERELDDLLAAIPDAAAEAEADQIARLLDLLRTHRLTELRRDLEKATQEIGPAAFLRRRIAPLMMAVGRAWADSEIEIQHEHALTQVVEDVLRALKQSLPRAKAGPLLVLATLPGETHGLGLQMVELAAQLKGVRTYNLGADTPLEEITAAVEGTGATGVAISVSLASGGIQTDRLLADLHRRLPDDVRVLVGGAGARGVRRGPRGIEYVDEWDALDDWFQDFTGRQKAPKKAS